MLPPVRFEYNEENLYAPWTVRDQHGLVDLSFTPEVIRSVNIDALVLASHYQGPYGTFTGRIRTADGQEVPFENAFGMCEDFYVRT